MVIDNQKIIETLAASNAYDYNIDKTIEELLELAEVLMKQKLKFGAPKCPTFQDVIDEIGDVQIRLDILKELYGAKEVENRINKKLFTFSHYIKEDKYKGRI